MNSKALAILFMVFGLVFALVECGRLTERASDGDSDSSEGGDDNSASSSDDDDALRGRKTEICSIQFHNVYLRIFSEEKRAIHDFLENEQDASQFLDQSRRIFSDQKSHMKEAKKK